ncbi:MAG: host attachment protein [Caulobacteraceae bacterium]|nr:host attachment protein [Caulobacteraceae bacterium]
MTKPLRTEFIIADGGRARWVKRSDHADDFVTVKEITAEHHHTGGPQGVVFEASSGQRFSVEERDEAVKAHHMVFARSVGDAINAEAAAGILARLALVAPSHVLAAITEHLTTGARAHLAKTLAKDLGKTPDHELGTWLRPLETE